MNQITDIAIDKINKPYLPIAAGRLSKDHGIIVVVGSLISSLLLIKDSAWPLKTAVVGSCILGTLYSMPPFRLKRFPLLAAFCILVVRGSLVNMGFFLQAKIDTLGHVLPSFAAVCQHFPESVLLTVFYAIFGVVIALMKDVPDIQGDKMFQISSFSVKLGAKTMFDIAWRLLVFLLVTTSMGSISTLIVPQIMNVSPAATRVTTICRITLALVLNLFAIDVTKKANKVDIDKPNMIFKYYMHIWNIFYACYFLLPLVR